MNWPVLIAIALVIALFAVRRDVAQMWRDRRLNKASDAQMDAWRAKFARENPDTIPLSDAERDAIEQWCLDHALPAIRLDPVDTPVGERGSRIGGPVWLAPGQDWPVDAGGRKLEFVAQLDLGQLPPLPDFPTGGLLQFFIGTDDLYGADFEAPEAGSARVLWRQSVEGGVRMPLPELTDDRCSPLDKATRTAGRALAGTAARMLPAPEDWTVDQRLKGQLRRAGIGAITDFLCEHPDRAPDTHHVGGYPVFTQGDFRAPGKSDALDRVLIRFTSADGLVWGDVGEAVFLIARDDLIARRFDRAVFHWDCT